jgi:hypothetical protein
MDKFFIIVAFIAMIGVVVSLLGGMVAMGRGKGTKKDNETSNKLMQARVICQGIAIGTLVLAYMAKH